MARYHLGPSYGISTDELSFVHIVESGQSESRRRMTTLLSVEARVCMGPPRLCLRIQNWALPHTKIPEVAITKMNYVRVCPHYLAEKGQMLQIIKATLDDYIMKPGMVREPNRYMCFECNFVFDVEILETKSDGLAIIVTKWLNLGSGLTPSDPRWRILTAGISDSQRESIYAREAGDCRMAFEKGEGLTQQAVTLRNEAYLNHQKYKSMMTAWGRGSWVLQANQRRQRFTGLNFKPLFLIILASTIITIIEVLKQRYLT